MTDKSLARTSLLNFLTIVADHFLRLTVQFIMNPLILMFVGPAHFGLWQMLNRFTSYLNAPAGQPSQALKLIVARDQQEICPQFKRKSIGAAVGIWLLMIPVFLTGGFILITLVLKFVELPSQDLEAVKWTMIILVGSTLIRELSVIPMNVIVGMNQTYKLMGLKSGSQIVVAIATWLLLMDGYGLTGMAAAQTLGVVTLGLFGMLLAKRFFHWFGIECPAWKFFKTQFKFNTWYITSQIIGVVNMTSDVLLIGIVISPTAVTSYVLVGFAPSLLTVLGSHIAGASLATQGKLLSKSTYKRFKHARDRLFLYTWSLMTCGGCLIIIFNQSFISLWVGREYFPSQTLNITLVLASLATGLLKLEEASINASLNLKNKVKLSALITTLSITAAVVLASKYGILGVAVAFVTGRILLFIAYHLILHAIVPILNDNPRRLTRSVVATLLIIGGCGHLGENIQVDSWITLFTLMIPTALIICVVFWVLALNSAQRMEMRAILNKGFLQLNTLYQKQRQK